MAGLELSLAASTNRRQTRKCGPPSTTAERNRPSHGVPVRAYFLLKAGTYLRPSACKLQPYCQKGEPASGQRSGFGAPALQHGAHVLNRHRAVRADLDFGLGFQRMAINHLEGQRQPAISPCLQILAQRLLQPGFPAPAAQRSTIIALRLAESSAVQ